MLRHAHDFNRVAGNGRYHLLSNVEIADRVRSNRIGLMLSEEEGANYASIQYLLCGLGVVSTESRGGRDEFFDPSTTLIVDADAAAIRQGVEDLISRNLDPSTVRATTLKKVEEHRARLLDRLQQIYDSEGIERSAAADWDSSFKDKMVSPQSHAAVIASFERVLLKR